MKRHLLRVGIFLLLGAATTVVVAWGLGFFSLQLSTGPPAERMLRYRGHDLFVHVYGDLGISEVLLPPDFQVPPSLQAVPRLIWAEHLLRNEPPLPDGHPPMPTARGFPAVSMACLVGGYIDQRGVWRHEVRHGVLLEPTDQWAYRVIPFAPLWRGFAIDTICYGVL